MRTAIAQRQHGVPAAQHVASGAFETVAFQIAQRAEQQLAPVILQQQIIDDVERRASATLRDRTDAVVQRGMIVGRIAQREQQLVLGNDMAEVGVRGGRLLAQQYGAQRRIAQPRDLFRQRQIDQRLERGVEGERMKGQVQPHEDGGRPRAIT